MADGPAGCCVPIRGACRLYGPGRGWPGLSLKYADRPYSLLGDATTHPFQPPLLSRPSRVFPLRPSFSPSTLRDSVHAQFRAPKIRSFIAAARGNLGGSRRKRNIIAKGFYRFIVASVCFFPIDFSYRASKDALDKAVFLLESFLNNLQDICTASSLIWSILCQSTALRKKTKIVHFGNDS